MSVAVLGFSNLAKLANIQRSGDKIMIRSDSHHSDFNEHMEIQMEERCRGIQYSCIIINCPGA